VKDIDCLIVNGDSYSAPDVKFPVYAEYLANHFDVPLFNIAVTGSPNDRILRSTVHTINKLKSQYKNPLVIIGWSFLHRIEVWYHGSNEKVISRAPDQFSNGSQLRFLSMNWIPDDEISPNTKDFLTAVDTIDKKIIDWYLHLFLLSTLFKYEKISYLFFSAANNQDFPIQGFPALRDFSFVQQVIADPNIYNLDSFCIPQWAGINDTECDQKTGHLSNKGHQKFANFLLDKIK